MREDFHENKSEGKEIVVYESDGFDKEFLCHCSYRSR